MSVSLSIGGGGAQCGLVLAATPGQGELVRSGPGNTDAVLRRAATVFRESPVGGSGDGDGVCPGAGCARVASSEGLSVFSLSARSVCAHVVGCCDPAPVYLDFAVRVSACLCLKSVCTCAACLEGVRLYRVCSGGLGAVPVFPRDWVCTVVGPRLRVCTRLCLCCLTGIQESQRVLVCVYVV